MNSKRLWIGCFLGFVGLQLAFFSNLMLRLEAPQDMSPVGFIDIETAWHIEDTRTPVDELADFSLCVDGIPLPYDRESLTFYYPLPLDSSHWPELALTSPAGSCVIAGLIDDVTWDDKQSAIASSTRYELIAYDDTAYAYYGLVFTGLPALSIHTQPQQEITLDRISAQIRLYDPERADFTQAHSEIRLRGAGTLVNNQPKRGYRFWLTQQGRIGQMVDQPLPLLGMSSLASWNLLPIYADPSLMREKAGLDIWKGFQTGASDSFFGIQGEYVELFVDDVYCGVYLLGETVDKPALATRGHTSRFQQDYLYRGVAAWYDWAFRYEVYFDPHGKTADCGFHLRYPDYGSAQVPDADWANLETYLALRDTMDWETFRSCAGELLDVPSVVDYWLLLQALALTDNDFNNVNIWARDTGSGYMLSLFPWDLSDSWGGLGGAASMEQLMDDWVWEQGEDTLLLYFGGIIPFRLTERVLAADINGSQTYLAERWAQLRAGVLHDDAIAERFAVYLHQLNDSGAALRDKEKWFGLAEYVTLGEDMILWLQVRCSLLDAYFEQMDWSSLWTQIE